MRRLIDLINWSGALCGAPAATSPLAKVLHILICAMALLTAVAGLSDIEALRPVSTIDLSALHRLTVFTLQIVS